MQIKKELWEVDDVDLNFRHYSGHPTSVLRRIKSDIEKYLRQPDVPQKSREIYSAIYHSLEYYKDISYTTSPEFSTDDTFLSYTLSMLNEDLAYLSSKYNSPDPTKPPVITLNGRIKSPISFIEKVKEKVNEYLEQDRNFGYFTESLRDLIGARIIVNPPQEIKNQGPEAETEFLYKVCYDLMAHRGLENQNQEELEPGQLKFLDVNTRHDKTKMQRIKERAMQKGYDEALRIGTDSPTIFIPTHRIPEIEQPHIETKIKDYVMYPKYRGYQSLHICVTPDYSNYIERTPTPSYILPSLSQDYSLEYQFRTHQQNEFAEHGTASHKLSYKTEQDVYHRLAVPFYLDVDKLEDLEESNEGQRRFRLTHPNKSIRLRNFAESFKRFYGISFADRFGISFKQFRNVFNAEDRTEILAGKKYVRFDAERNAYVAVPIPKFIAVTEEEQAILQNSLSSKTRATNNEILRIFDKYGVSDCCINPSSSVPTNLYRASRIKLIPVVTAFDRAIFKANQDDQKTDESSLDAPTVDDEAR